jgi:hypothetical protein
MGQFEGWSGMIFRSLIFSSLMIIGVIKGELTPDAAQMIDQFKTKLGIK